MFTMLLLEYWECFLEQRIENACDYIVEVFFGQLYNYKKTY